MWGHQRGPPTLIYRPASSYYQVMYGLVASGRSSLRSVPSPPSPLPPRSTLPAVPPPFSVPPPLASIGAPLPVTPVPMRRRRPGPVPFRRRMDVRPAHRGGVDMDRRPVGVGRVGVARVPEGRGGIGRVGVGRIGLGIGRAAADQQRSEHEEPAHGALPSLPGGDHGIKAAARADRGGAAARRVSLGPATRRAEPASAAHRTVLVAVAVRAGGPGTRCGTSPGAACAPGDPHAIGGRGVAWIGLGMDRAACKGERGEGESESWAHGLLHLIAIETAPGTWHAPGGSEAETHRAE